MQIMLRHAEDDFTALTIANAMMRAGAEIISITDAGGPPHAATTGRFILWAKVRDEAHIADVDASIYRPNAVENTWTLHTQERKIKMETVHLIGTEDVINAGHNIASAAEDMQRAADTMSCAFENQQRWMEQWLEHLEHILDKYQINKDDGE